MAQRGRPTKYNDSMLDRAYDYLDNYMACGDVVPSIAGLADELGICEKTCYNWAEKFPEFLQSLERVKTRQHRRLLNGGLNNEFNSTIVKLGLTTNHGYSDKSATDLTTQGEPVTGVTWEVIKSPHETSV